MSSLNKVLLIGNLGRDPETRYTAGGDAVTTLNVATTEKWKDKNSGEQKEATEWHRVVLFGRVAEVASQYLAKGSAVYLEGKLVTRKWQDKSGADRYTTEVVASEMKMLGGRGESSGRAPDQDEPAPRAARPAPAPASSGGGQGGLSDMDDDIPFARLGAGASWRVL